MFRAGYARIDAWAYTGVDTMLRVPIRDQPSVGYGRARVFTGPAGLIHLYETFRSLGADAPAQVELGVAPRPALDPSEFCSLPRWQQTTASTGITYCYIVNPCAALAMFSAGPVTYSINVTGDASCPASLRTVEANRIRTIVGSFQ